MIAQYSLLNLLLVENFKEYQYRNFNFSTVAKLFYNIKFFMNKYTNLG